MTAQSLAWKDKTAILYDFSYKGADQIPEFYQKPYQVINMHVSTKLPNCFKSTLILVQN